MTTIGIDSFRSAVTSRPDDSVLRISRHTGDVTAKPHGLLSRLVRFVAGPTEGDLRDNKRIADQFITQMRAEFGPAIAQQALLHAGVVRNRADGSFAYQPAKPLDARTITAALAQANTLAGALDAGEANTELARLEASLDPFPSTLAEREPDTLRRPMTQRRMQFELGAYKLDVDAQSGVPVNVDAQMSRIASFNKASDPARLQTALGAYGELRERVGDLARLCGAKAENGAQAFAVLQNLRDLNEEVLATGAVTKDGKISPDERELPQHAAVLAFLRNLDPKDALALAEAMGRPDSNAALLSEAFNDALGDISSVRETALFGAVTETMKVFTGLVGELDRLVEEREPETGGSSSAAPVAERLGESGIDPQDARVGNLAALIRADGEARAHAAR